MCIGCGQRAEVLRKWIESDCIIINNTGVVYSADIPYIGLFNIHTGKNEFKNALVGARVVRFINKLFPDALTLEVDLDGSEIINAT